MEIITDGDKDRQAKKIEKTKLKNYFNWIIFTKDYEAKPSSIPFEIAKSKVPDDSYDILYVADNPKIDFVGAKKTGMITVRIKRGEFIENPNDENIDWTIRKLEEILNLLRNWGKLQ